MRTLNFTVNGQTLSKNGDFTGLARGSKSYLQCKFEFNEDWAAAVKVAEFGSRSQKESVLIEDDACMIPDEVLHDRQFTIRVVGKDGETIITTNQIAIRQGG